MWQLNIILYFDRVTTLLKHILLKGVGHTRWIDVDTQTDMSTQARMNLPLTGILYYSNLNTATPLKYATKILLCI